MLTKQIWINITNVQHGLKNIQPLAYTANVYAWSSGKNWWSWLFRNPLQHSEGTHFQLQGSAMAFFSHTTVVV